MDHVDFFFLRELLSYALLPQSDVYFVREYDDKEVCTFNELKKVLESVSFASILVLLVH